MTGVIQATKTNLQSKGIFTHVSIVVPGTLQCLQLYEQQNVYQRWENGGGALLN